MRECELPNRLRAGKHAGRRRGFLTKKKLKNRSKYFKDYCGRLLI